MTFLELWLQQEADDMIDEYTLKGDGVVRICIYIPLDYVYQCCQNIDKLSTK